ncbi:MAG: hypothetical protein H6668_10770 [Ardenticatenaceae bacterium]|nr:hypothetical protein [Ardenticatenaceae bacterium]
MAQFKLPEGYSNIIAIWGDDVVQRDSQGDYYLNRTNLRTNLFSERNPLGNLKGKVDFVVCFVVKRQGAPDYSQSSIEHNLYPRPLRGIVQLRASSLENLTAKKIGDVLGGTIAHELNHYWLVPGTARIRLEGQLVNTPTADNIEQAFREGEPCPPFPIIGRQDAHWSPFLNAGNTVMDGVQYEQIEATPYSGLCENDNYVQVKTCKPDGNTFTFNHNGNQMAIKTIGSNSQLEKWIMGLPDIPDTSQFLALDPQWVFPSLFQSGLYLELETNGNIEAWYLGYDQGPHQIMAQKVGDSSSTSSISLPSAPLDPNREIGLRTIQENTTVKLQVRTWLNPTYQQLTEASVSIPSIDSGNWQTIHSLSGKLKRIGISTRTYLTEITYMRTYTLLSADLCLSSEGEITPIRLEDLEKEFPNFEAHEQPRLLSNGRLMTPWTGSFLETRDKHDAPKLTMIAPDKDFIFAGIFKLDACVINSWAGLTAANRTIIGKKHLVKFKDFQLPWTNEEQHRRQEQPLNDEYMTLFCIAAQDEAQITDHMIEGLEQLRLAWEDYYPRTVDGHRHANTNLQHSYRANVSIKFTRIRILDAGFGPQADLRLFLRVNNQHKFWPDEHSTKEISSGQSYIIGETFSFTLNDRDPLGIYVSGQDVDPIRNDPMGKVEQAFYGSQNWNAGQNKSSLSNEGDFGARFRLYYDISVEWL